ncbi:MAG: ATP-binding protein [Anaerolineales bacterium]
MGNTDSFGYWLKRRRKALDLTQAALADRVGCAVVTIKKIEADERRPSRQIAARLAEALAIPEQEQEAFIQTARGLQAVHRLEMAQEPLQAPATAANATPPPVKAALAAVLHPDQRLRLVGRAQELDLIRQTWEQAKAGQMRMILIQGEPGIGKTRLAEELLAEIAASSGEAAPVMLRGGCFEFEAAVPYLPVAEALRSWVLAQPAAVLQPHLGQSAPDLARLVPELETHLGIQPEIQAGSLQEQRLRLYDAASRFLETLALSFGLVLFIDDLHWIDQGTLALLAHMLRRLQAAPFLFVATYREVEFERLPALTAARLDWRRYFQAKEISLKRLDVAETNSLLANLFAQERISDEFSKAIYNETEGNPFFVVEMAHALIDQGFIFRVEDRWERQEIEDLALPSTIKDTLQRRLDLLSPDCLELLRYAALLGKQFLFPELVAVLEKPEDQLVNPLDEALAARLLQPGEGEIFRFSHDKIREVLYVDQNQVRQRVMHRQCAERLEATYQAAPDKQPDALAGRLANHFFRAGEYARSLEYARQAADHAIRLFASDEALGYLQQALICAQALDLQPVLADLHEQMGDLYAQNGPFGAAIEHYQQVAAHVDQVPRQLAIQVKLGHVYADIGDPRGQPMLEAALKMIDAENQPELWTKSLVALGRFLHYQAHYSQALAYYEQALPGVEASEDHWMVTRLYGYIAGCHQHLTNFPTSNAWAYKTVTYAQEHAYPYGEAIGYEFLAENLSMQGRWDEAIEAALLDAEIGHQHGIIDRVAWSLLPRSWAYYDLGEFDQAAQCFEECAELAESIKAERLAVLSNIYWVRLLVDQGQDKQAQALGQQNITLADEQGEVQLKYNSRLSMAYLCLRQGDLTEALDWVRQANSILSDSEISSVKLFHKAVEAMIYLQVGDTETARSLAEAGLEHARSADAPFHMARNLHVLARLNALLGLHANAESAFREALDLLEATSSRLELGRCLASRAAFNRQIGKLESARSDHERAVELFRWIGARRDLRALEQNG